MKLHCEAIPTCCLIPAQTLLAFALAGAASAAIAQAPLADVKSADTKLLPESYQTLYLTNLTQQNDLNDVLTDLRNMLPSARLYGMPSQSAISIRGTAEDIQTAQRIVSDLDRAKKLYRLTYTIHDAEGGARTGAHAFTLIVASGGKTSFRQGSRVPIVTGTSESTNNSQVQYMDIGLNIEASVDGFVDGLRLRSKVEQTDLADEKSGIGTQDPIVRQTVLDGTSTLVPGKPLVLGSLDLPGSSHKQEIEVVAELVK